MFCYTYARGFRVLDSCISSSLFLFGSGSLLVLLTRHAQQSYLSAGVLLFAVYIVFSLMYFFLVCSWRLCFSFWSSDSQDCDT